MPPQNDKNDRELAQKIYRDRMAVHADGIGTTLCCQDADYLGALGEIEFANQFHLDVDLAIRHGGDKGRDFVTTSSRESPVL